MSSSIDKEATDEEIKEGFVSTPREDQISGLARTIGEWGWRNLSGLRLVDRGFKEKELKKLLEAVVDEDGGSDPVIHLLVRYDQTSTFTSLLDGVTSHHHLLSLISLKSGYYQLNVLSRAVRRNKSTIYNYIKNRISDDEFYRLLCERGDGGSTGLHEAVMWNKPVSGVLSLVKDETRSHHLLSIREDEGLTVLSCSIYWGGERSFQSIISHYADKQVKLLELASFPDREGNTSFHRAAGRRTSNYLITLLSSTYSLNTRVQLSTVLSLRNASGGKKRKGYGGRVSHSDNELIYDWVVDSLTNNRYLLFDFPSVLIMYTTKDRPGADKEAESLEKCFNHLGIEVKAKNSFTKKELFDAIKEGQGGKASRQGQIVALMSHGTEGCIKDSGGERIPLKDIEGQMCPDSHRDTPKLLIVQCCQYVGSDDTTSSPSTDAGAANPNPSASFCPRYPDFCALMSTGARAGSQQNTFIPFLAKAITSADVNFSISDVMDSVKREFPVTNSDVPEQAPSCQLSPDSLKFCFKNILPIYLPIARQTKLKTAKRKRPRPNSAASKPKAAKISP